ncbi:P-loop containing nucleoside triphosphate hydrolase protein [Syncephalastrum racemosum]|uniref:P-loop containing nucleoside triphosphate hydrolase protein n=1 Tax=Syncephalastrum racemosum TaxID=13706 RepID=A0A1X2HF83_SYNRA|nr:P-loop containing nucleoside triphosphate hydrolase protein [Syncephalastrum racemosum]
MAPMYYRGAQAALLVYDITSQESFVELHSWIEELKRNMTEELVIVVVANKLDLGTTRREVPEEQAREYVTRVLGPETPFYEVSAKDDDGTIEDIFLHLTRTLVDRKQYSMPQNNKRRQAPISIEEPPAQSSSCCGFF